MRFVAPGTTVALLLLATLPAAASGAPTCAEGPQIVGNTYVGTPCADVIRAPRAVTTVRGEGGGDVLYGQRGNDTLLGGDGNDRLYGGIGDDEPLGGPGDDLLSGGFGADFLDGGPGADFVRGDATIDAIDDSGDDAAIDTLSHATGVTPGFTNTGSFFDYEGFPSSASGRGVYVDLEDDGASDGNGFAHDGEAPAGGGVDLDLEGESFERVIGTPFPDFIVGSAGAEEIHGGGGGDVILGEGGADQISGGANGDYCAGAGASVSFCEFGGGDKEVEPRDTGATASGSMAPAGAGPPALYLTGSIGDDTLTATYSPSAQQVAFTANGNPAGTFSLPQAPDSVVVAGLEGDDALTASTFPETTSVILLGGEGNDSLTGGETEDAAVDGGGNDSVDAGGRDDAVPNNQGDDSLHAGGGEDLFISDSVCEGDLIDGGPDRDNANWANFETAIAIDMAAGIAGRAGPGGQPTCSGEGPPTGLEAIEDVEGTSLADSLSGDSGPNQLLGRRGADSYFAAGGNDVILANSAFPANPGDTDPAIDCGEGWDTALIDIPTQWTADASPIACEDVEERAPNSFRPPRTPPDPDPPPAEEPRFLADVDRSPPRTRILHRPPRVVFAGRRWRRVSFRFAADEAGAGFRCKLGSRRFAPCDSPRAYRVRPGRHAFRVFAIDAAGNRDRSPALFKFRVYPRRPFAGRPPLRSSPTAPPPPGLVREGFLR